MKKLLALTGLALAVSTTAHAVEQPYIGFSLAQPSFEDDGGGDAAPTVAQLRFGTNLNKYLGMQAVVSVNAGEDTLVKPAVPTDVKYEFTVDSMYTLSAVLRMPFGESAAVYGHLGYSYAQLSLGSLTPGFVSIEDNLDGMAYGVGIVLPIGGGFMADVDFTSYLNGDDTLGGLGLGIRKNL
jgi:opacity protein-like surface antigen